MMLPSWERGREATCVRKVRFVSARVSLRWLGSRVKNPLAEPPQPKIKNKKRALNSFSRCVCRQSIYLLKSEQGVRWGGGGSREGLFCKDQLIQIRFIFSLCFNRTQLHVRRYRASRKIQKRAVRRMQKASDATHRKAATESPRVRCASTGVYTRDANK